MILTNLLIIAPASRKKGFRLSRRKWSYPRSDDLRGILIRLRQIDSFQS